MHADGCSRDPPDLQCNKNSKTFMNFAIHTDSKMLGQCTNPVSKLTKSFLVCFLRHRILLYALGKRLVYGVLWQEPEPDHSNIVVLKSGICGALRCDSYTPLWYGIWVKGLLSDYAINRGLVTSRSWNQYLSEQNTWILQAFQLFQDGIV